MKKEFDYNVNPLMIAVTATIITLIEAITSGFGTLKVPSRGFGRGVLNGTVLLITFLIMTVIYKGYRKYVWTKKGLITLFVALAINLAIGVYCLINQYELNGYFVIV